ncbi:MAG: class I SAM-dependent methyltransferase [Actinomycetota bacterium]|nr:class I SAM-dependent methyltransferase [Actinomycetota bacterium]
MSLVERAFCRSAGWSAFTRTRVLPWALQGVRPAGRVLEIGAGSAAMAAAMVETHPDITLTVTDYDPSMVGAARRRLRDFEQVNVRQADATDLPFDDDTFDTVVSFIMLHHVGAWELALAEAVRVLRSGGTLVGYDLLASWPAKTIHQLEGAEHRLIVLSDLRSTFSDLPVTDVTVRRGLGGIVARFHARTR